MKKLILLLLPGVILVSCSKKDQAKIRLDIPALEGKAFVVEEQRVDGVKIIDSLLLSPKGKINFSLDLRQPGFYNLNVQGGQDIYFLLFPGDRIKVKQQAADGSPTLVFEGSPESTKLNYLYDSLFSARKSLDKIRKNYFISENLEEKEKLNAAYLSELEKYRKFSMQFVLDNLHSLVSVAALYQEIGPDEFVFGRKRDLQFFKLVTDTLTKYYPKHRHVLALQRNFKQMLGSFQLERLLTNAGEVQEGLPGIELPGINGKSISLESIKEQYVLLNFWQHSDGTSQNLFPDLNKVYARYHSKGFNIFNVYLGKSSSLWEKIVNFEEIGHWVNVADTSFPYSKTRLMYNIVAIPANYLVDTKKQEILGKDLSPGQLNQKLSELVK
ncbi:MAG: TlpA family protein disulfide reductase [Bacteroidales bacterium]|nr:TlpA family protein disulfide reductase [Bacteroidales bacterium]